MGGSGKKLRGHGARQKANSPALTAADGGWGPLPHPLRIVAGQRFSPLESRRRRAVRVTRSMKSGVALAVKADGRRERVALRVDRLLAVDRDGRGRYYRFLGYQAGGSYRTWAYVAGVNGEVAQLCLPEWHPRRPVRFPLRLLPAAGNEVGTWLDCTADLGQPHAAKLNLADLRPCTDPGEAVCHLPDLSVASPADCATRNSAGRGSADEVVEVTEPEPPEPA